MLISQWLRENVDSHGFHSVSLLGELPEPMKYDPQTDILTYPGKKPARLHSRTVREELERHGAFETGDPKGLVVYEDVDLEERGISGFALSATLDVMLTGEDAGGGFFGRGSAHRARVNHLEAKGF